MNTKEHARNIGSKNGGGEVYRVIAKDTSTGRPWMWGAMSLDMAKLLAETLIQEIDQAVDIVKLVGTIQRKPYPTEYIEPKEKNKP